MAVEKAKGARTGLKIFSWYYLIEAVFLIILGIAVINIPKALSETITAMNIDLQGADPKIVIGIVFGIIAVISFIESILFRRLANGKSKGTLLMILVILSTISGVYTLIKSFTFGNATSLVINGIALYAIIKTRNANQNA